MQLLTQSIVITQSWLFILSVSLKLKYSLKEESVIGYLIGNVKVDSGISNRIHENSDNITFELYEEENLKQYFKLNSKTGQFYVAQRIDREKLCSYKELGEVDTNKGTNCIMSLTIFVPKEHWINVELNIQDINDHTPKFDTAWHSIEIDERVSLNFEVLLILAKDSDVGQNNIQSYKLQESWGLFGVRYDPPFTLALRVIGKLDYDKEDGKNYTLKLIACDNGITKKCGSQILYIKINDYNDNPPIFTQSEYSINITENSPIGTAIIQVKAEDKDSGQYGTVSYFLYESNRIVAQKAFNYISYFKISKNSGHVILNRNLDAKVKPSYMIKLEARDSGELPLIGQAILKVTVNDINDHAPKILVKPKPKSADCTLSVKENNFIDKILGVIVSTDGDIGDNGKINCKIIDEKNWITLKLSNSGDDRLIYGLKANHVFDREVIMVHKVEVICNDFGATSLSSSRLINVCIEDVNEFTPVVISKVSTVNVSENSLVGKSIYRLTVADNDATQIFNFKLIKNINEYFDIDQHSGVIGIKKHLDREVMERSYLVVEVTDGIEGQIRFSESFTLTVNIIDFNDNKPYLIEASKQFHVIEGEYSINKELFKLVAHDNDTGINAKVEFTISNIDQNDPKRSLKASPVFRIDRQTGAVYALNEIDREKHNSFQLSVLLTDKGSPPQTSEEIVNVIVDDRNDNRPIWFYPDSSQLSKRKTTTLTSTKMTENGVDDGDGSRSDDYLLKEVVNVTHILYPGQVVTTIRAYDHDSGENSNITYRIVRIEPVEAAKIESVTNSDYVSNRGRRGGNDAGKRQSEKKENRQLLLFSVSPISGTIQIRDFMRLHKYTLYLQASDNGKPQLHSKIAVLEVHYWPLDPSKGGLFSGNGSDPVSVSIIAAMAGVTGIICISLLVAICLVRRKSHMGPNASQAGYHCATPHDPTSTIYGPAAGMYTVETLASADPQHRFQPHSQFVTHGSDPLLLDAPFYSDYGVMTNKWPISTAKKPDFYSVNDNGVGSDYYVSSSLRRSMVQRSCDNSSPMTAGGMDSQNYQLNGCYSARDPLLYSSPLVATLPRYGNSSTADNKADSGLGTISGTRCPSGLGITTDFGSRASSGGDSGHGISEEDQLHNCVSSGGGGGGGGGGDEEGTLENYNASTFGVAKSSQLNCPKMQIIPNRILYANHALNHELNLSVASSLKQDGASSSLISSYKQNISIPNPCSLMAIKSSNL